MARLVLAAVIVVAAVTVAAIVRSRRSPDSPTQRRFELPRQLDRGDFGEPDVPWLVVVFSSASCHTCADVTRKAVALRSAQLAVQEVEYAADRGLHERYGIDGVPAVVLADGDGVVRYGHLGPITATDLWADIAAARGGGAAGPAADVVD